MIDKLILYFTAFPTVSYATLSLLLIALYIIITSFYWICVSEQCTGELGLIILWITVNLVYYTDTRRFVWVALVLLPLLLLLPHLMMG